MPTLGCFLSVSIWLSFWAIDTRAAAGLTGISGEQSGFYAIPSNSDRWMKMGFIRAPVDEPTPFNNGYGTDAVAITFDRNGKVNSPPVYIYTITADTNQERKLRLVVPGISTMESVRRLYGRPFKTNVGGTQVWYYSIPVFNPFVQFPSER
ncbi:MAG: hypothetical protein JO076_01185 [Verrucomicrobia bacterium]|nr:hypothetical protein [Verrucomicrobiota bacterium]